MRISNVKVEDNRTYTVKTNLKQCCSKRSFLTEVFYTFFYEYWASTRFTFLTSIKLHNWWTLNVKQIFNVEFNKCLKYNEYRALKKLQMSNFWTSHLVIFHSQTLIVNCVHVQRINNIRYSTDIKRRHRTRSLKIEWSRSWQLIRFTESVILNWGHK